MMVGSTGNHVVLPVMNGVAATVYGQISDDYTWLKSLFRSDRLIEVGHWVEGSKGIEGNERSEGTSGYRSLRSSSVRDEL